MQANEQAKATLDEGNASLTALPIESQVELERAAAPAIAAVLELCGYLFRCVRLYSGKWNRPVDQAMLFAIGDAFENVGELTVAVRSENARSVRESASILAETLKCASFETEAPRGTAQADYQAAFRQLSKESHWDFGRVATAAAALEALASRLAVPALACPSKHGAGPATSASPGTVE